MVRLSVAVKRILEAEVDRCLEELLELMTGERALGAQTPEPEEVRRKADA